MLRTLLVIAAVSFLSACASTSSASRPRSAAVTTPPVVAVPPPDQSATPDATRQAHREAVAKFEAGLWSEECEVLAAVSERRALTDFLEALCRAHLNEIATAADLAERALDPQGAPALAADQARAAHRLLAWVAAIQDELAEEAQRQLNLLQPVLPPHIPPNASGAISAWRDRGPAHDAPTYNATRASLPPSSLGARLRWSDLFTNAHPLNLGFLFGDFDGGPFVDLPQIVLPKISDL